MSLEITVSEMKKVRLLEVSGRVDSVSADDLKAALEAALRAGYNQVVVDLHDVEYMSSAGLRELVSALKQANRQDGDLRLANPSDRVMEVLELAGLNTIFQVFPTRADAIGSF
jgi:anti-sigma B factor antagonist